VSFFLVQERDSSESEERGGYGQPEPDTAAGVGKGAGQQRPGELPGREPGGQQAKRRCQAAGRHVTAGDGGNGRGHSQQGAAEQQGRADQWRGEFGRNGFGRGCPIVATVADAAANDQVREAARQAFERWQEPVTVALTQMGVPTRRAPALALLMLSTLEGAIVVARVRRDNGPLDTVVGELGPLLDSAVDGRDSFGRKGYEPNGP